MIKAILFDFGQTLVDSSNGFRAAEKEAHTKIFSDLDLASYDEFLATYRKLRKKFYSNSNFSRKALWQEVYRRCNHVADVQLLEKWEHDYWERVKTETTLFPETTTVLERLAGKKYQIALITNTQGQSPSKQHRFIQFPELEKFFRVIIVAGEAGIPPKPDPAPFLACLERLNILPYEAVYVGDDWRIDICGAKGVGIQPVWIKHESVHRSWPDVTSPVPVITCLDCLFGLKNIFHQT